MKIPGYVKSNIQYRAWMIIGFIGAVLSALYMIRVGLENSGGAMILFVGLSLMCGRMAVLRARYKRDKPLLS